MCVADNKCVCPRYCRVGHLIVCAEKVDECLCICISVRASCLCPVMCDQLRQRCRDTYPVGHRLKNGRAIHEREYPEIVFMLYMSPVPMSSMYSFIITVNVAPSHVDSTLSGARWFAPAGIHHFVPSSLTPLIHPFLAQNVCNDHMTTSSIDLFTQIKIDIIDCSGPSIVLGSRRRMRSRTGNTFDADTFPQETE